MRLIDADVLLKELEWLEDDRPVFNDVMRTIDKAPSVDAVPVVHCKDCIHAECFDERYGVICGIWWGWFALNEYCTNGERKKKQDAKR